MHALFDRPGPRRVSLGEYPMWDEALALLNRDLAVTLPEQEPLQLLALPSYEADEPENVFVAMANGEWHGNQLFPASAEDPADALANIADAAQETVAERLWHAWPLCAEHEGALRVGCCCDAIPWPHGFVLSHLHRPTAPSTRRAGRRVGLRVDGLRGGSTAQPQGSHPSAGSRGRP